MKISFDQFKLDTDIAELKRGDKEVALEPRAYSLLVFLISKRERVVSKDEIINAVWDGRFTSDSALTTCIKSLRKALQDDGEQQRFIKTLRGRGFRFVADVITTDQKETISSSITPKPKLDTGKILPTQTQTIFQGKPSIIVLPFQNFLAAQQDSVIAEAMAHDLIQALSRLRWLRVIARGTAFQFRMPAPDLKSIGQQLNLRYALSGSIEALGHMRVISVELSDCDTSDVIWAERFEVKPDELHQIRQTILASVVSSLEMYIPLNEASQAALSSSENLDAWANYHLGLRYMFRFTADDNSQAAHYFSQAINQDGRFARAYAGLSFTRFQDAFLRYDHDINKAIADARRLAEQSVELDSLDPFTNYNMGRSFWLSGEAEVGLGWLERSVALSPNFAQGHYSRAFCEVMQGQIQLALENTERSLNLSPLDPLLYGNYAIKSFSYLRLGDLPNAVYWAEKAASTPGAHFLIFMIAAAIHALSGDVKKTQYWCTRVKARKPDASSVHFFSAFPFVDDALQSSLKDGLQRAQL
ncbi:MAG: winged helix-turn-helix domain-containing protein [Cellvibrio sp.]|uniref:winged helix-turn-helix domain-containing tetratricopeptide repeat protein n=1 Tax=Cellvibrio sp. TaxID=1965322 RepID=UPI0031A59E60